MHISEFWFKSSILRQICIKYAFFRAGKYAKNMHFTRENAYFLQIWRVAKMHISEFWSKSSILRKYASNMHFSGLGNMQKICILPGKMHIFCRFGGLQKCILVNFGPNHPF